MGRIEDGLEGRLMATVLGEKDPICYPHIVVVEENGNVRMIKLGEEIKEVLATLPPEDKKTLELRFGLLDGKSRTLKQVGQELWGITPEGARRRVNKALRRLRHPSRLKSLKRFIVPSPEEVSRLWKEIKCLRDENQSFGDENQRLKKILEGRGVKEEDIERIRQESLVSVKALEEDRAALQTLISQFPNTHVWNAIRRGGVTELSQLKSLVGRGETRIVRNIGVGGRKFLKEVLQKTEKEASP